MERRKIRRLGNRLCAITMFLFVSQSFAGTNAWTNLGPDGGFINQVSYHPTAPSVAYASAQGGFFRTTDNGMTWQSGSLGWVTGPLHFQVDQSNGDRIYFASYLHPNISTDRGANFQELSLPGNQAIGTLAVSRDGTAVYTNANSPTSSRNIYRSLNAGQTWEFRGSVPASSGGVSLLVVDPTDATKVFATTIDGLFVSVDGGANWSQRGAAWSSYFANGWKMVIDPQTPSRMWALITDDRLLYSNDSGNTWQDMYTRQVPVANDAARELVLGISDPTVVYIGLTNGKILSRTIAAGPWNEVGQAPGYIRSIAINPAQETQLLVATQEGIYTTTVGSNSWAPRNAGVNATFAYSIQMGSQSPAYFLVSSNQAFKTDGASVTALNTAALLSALPYFAGGASLLHVQPGAQDHLFVTFDNQIAKSVDGGASWTRLPDAPLHIKSMLSSASNRQIVYAGTDDGVLKSVDGGNQWTPINSGLPSNTYITSLSFGGTQSVLYAGTNTIGVYKSINAGQSWTAANSGIANHAVSDLAVDPTNDQIVYAATSTTVAKTINGGGTWMDLSAPSNPQLSGERYQAIAVDSSNPKVIYALTGRTLQRSVDGGTTWQAVFQAQNFSLPEFNSMKLDRQRANTVIAASFGQGLKTFTVANDLSLALTASAAPTTNAAATYTLNATNVGPWDATDIVVRIQLPASATQSSATATGATCSTAASVVTCRFDALKTNVTVPVTLTTTPSATGSFQVSASIQGAQTDIAANNNSVTETATVVDPAPPVTPPTPTPTPTPTPAPTPAPTPSPTPAPTSTPSSSGGGSLSFAMLFALALLSLTRAIAMRRAD